VPQIFSSAVTSIHRLAVATLIAAALAGCLSPQASLLMGLLPEGTFTTLLSNMQSVDEPNRKKLAVMEQKGDWNGIAEFAQKNIAADQTNADWWVVAGYAYSQLKRFDRAAECFGEAVRLSPDEIGNWNLLAQAYRSLGQPERAIRTLDNALRVNQDSPMTYFLLGESFNDLKRADRAVTYYQQAVQRDPQFVEAIYQLGAAYARLGRKADFEATVQRLRELNPEAAKRLVAASQQAQ
jgi:tetratricopeptide (TPR) repeat protein